MWDFLYFCNCMLRSHMELIYAIVYLWNYQSFMIYYIKGESLSIPEEEMVNVALYHDFLKEFVRTKVIYGVNTGFGPMAQWRVSDDHFEGTSI